MSVSISFSLNQRGIRRLLKSPTGPVAREVKSRGARVQAAARGFINSQTGALARSIEVKLVYSRGEVGADIGSKLSYAVYVHDGTGIYGPAGRPIRPRRGKALVIRGSRSSNGKIYVNSVSGQRGIKYLERALKAAG